MQRTVTFLAWTPKRNFYDEKLECSLRFSVVNSSLLGTAREHESIHTLKVVMSDILLVNWGLPEAADPSAISENMVKLALQSAEDYIAGQLKKGPLEGVCLQIVGRWSTEYPVERERMKTFQQEGPHGPRRHRRAVAGSVQGLD